MSSHTISLVEELSKLSKEPNFEQDATIQAKALSLSKQLTSQLQKPADAALELAFWPAYAFCGRIAIELGLFNKLAESSTSLSSVDLAKATGAEELLIVRIMRGLSGFGYVEEVDEKRWKATKLTHALTIPPIAAGNKHFWDHGTGTMVKMQKYFREKGFSCPTDPANGCLQYAFGTDKEAFDFWHKDPDILDNFNTFMQGVRGSRPSWVEWFPVQEQILDGFDGSADSTLLVDVAGGRGHDIEAFKKKFPSQPGKLVLEDLPAVIEDIKSLDAGIERVKYDFFTPQGVKGARVYFFHFIMHDWSDEVVLKILSNTVSAMKKGYSKILLNEFILPDRNAPTFATGMDLNMMAMHAGRERTQHDWKSLLAKAGLEVKKFHFPAGDGEGIVEADLM